MTTREQLEYAAKAMGLDAVPFFEDLATKDEDGDYAVQWNPTRDQADSDRMACKLRAALFFSNGSVTAYSASVSGVKSIRHNNTDEDVCRAVREARMLVAVEIGRGGCDSYIQGQAKQEGAGSTVAAPSRLVWQSKEFSFE